MDESVPRSEKNDLLSLPINSLLWRYCLPTTISMLVIGAYYLIDGIFIGHYVGEVGLEDAVLSFPMLGFLYATGILLGMGSSALVSIKMGQKQHSDIAKIIQTVFILVVASSLFYIIFGTLFTEKILLAIGVSEQTVEMSHSYIYWHFALAFCPIASWTYTTLLRNDNKPTLVTVILVTGGILNVIFDWLFLGVLELRLTGAALASMLAQLITAIWAIFALSQTNSPLKFSITQLGFDLKLAIQIIINGIPSFLMELYLSFIIAIHNAALLWVGTAIHITAYSIITYIEDFAYLLFSGIALGTQPILSFNIGAKQYQRVKETFYKSVITTSLLAVIILVPIYVFPQTIIKAFSGNATDLLNVGVTSLHYYFWALPLEAILLIATAFFQAIGQSTKSSLVTIYKLITLSLFMTVFSWSFGVQGVWFVLGTSSMFVLIWVFWQFNRFMQNTTV
ncbi:MATE family efflux transporter [Shewanella sp. OPT22]|nr:MATE family efflux transporter [Shewanella sp. OPT22]